MEINVRFDSLEEMLGFARTLETMNYPVDLISEDDAEDEGGGKSFVQTNASTSDKPFLEVDYTGPVKEEKKEEKTDSVKEETPKAKRARIRKELDDAGIEYNIKSGTPTLEKLLEKSMQPEPNPEKTEPELEETEPESEETEHEESVEKDDFMGGSTTTGYTLSSVRQLCKDYTAVLPKEKLFAVLEKVGGARQLVPIESAGKLDAVGIALEAHLAMKAYGDKFSGTDAISIMNKVGGVKILNEFPVDKFGELKAAFEEAMSNA